MKKTDVVSELCAARAAHIRWLAYAEAMTQGMPLDKDQVPLTYTDCKFGDWYYGEGQKLSKLRYYAGIAEPHKHVHEVYMRIFNILYGEVNYSFLARLFGQAKKHEQEKAAVARRLLPELQEASKKLVHAMEMLETEVVTYKNEDI